MAAEVVTASMVRGYEVMERRSTRYDYEKVFWNSAYGLGLVGLGWFTVQLGWMISGLQDLKDQATEKVDKTLDVIKNPSLIGYYTYMIVYDYVEGDHVDAPVSDLEYPTSFAVQYYRDNPEAWAAYKEAYVQRDVDGVLVDDNGVPIKTYTPIPAEKRDAVKVLAAIDNIYARWGAALPAAVLVGNVGLEYVRVSRLRGDLKR